MSEITQDLDSEIDNDTLTALLEHITLPPQLPQKAPEPDREALIERALCAFAANAALNYAHEYDTGSETQRKWQVLAKALNTCGKRASAGMDSYAMTRDLHIMGDGDILALRIREQNAAVIVRRNANNTIFEVFEIAPSNSAVMECSGKLVRVFPGPAAQVSNSIANEKGFTEHVSGFLCTMDQEKRDEAIAKSSKAGTEHHEVRDSAHPRYISELFMGIIRGYGEIASPRLVQKRIADEVLWKSAFKPWRRSPTWLIIRVLIQTSVEDHEYKVFMVYLLAALLNFACRIGTKISSDMLHHARCKLARRVDKLNGDAILSWVESAVRSASTTVKDLLQSRWRNIQNQITGPQNPAAWPEVFDVLSDTEQTLPTSRKYLADILRFNEPRVPRAAFEPDRVERIAVFDFSDLRNEGLAQAIERHGHTAMLDFEGMVERHLDAWTRQRMNLTIPDACETIASCMEQYNIAARTLYKDSMPDRSVFVLTLTCLWRALDRLAIGQVPLLGEYSPQLPCDFLHPLLLHSRTDITRARELEVYLIKRHHRSVRGSIYRDDPHEDSFSWRYYEQSALLKGLKSRIESKASKTRRKRLAELTRSMTRYDSLIASAASLPHEEFWNSKRRRYTHDYKGQCQRCREERRAKGIKIDIFEWPLPSDPCAAASLVFELAAPLSFLLWRSMTYLVLVDIGLGSQTRPKAQPYVVLSKYEALVTYGSTGFHTMNRISLSSSTKSFAQSHYKTINLPAEPDDVCVANSLQLRLHDMREDLWVLDQNLSQAVTYIHGTLRLSENSPYEHLRYALQSTAHSTNKVIADRAACPSQLSLSEHDAFGALRSGARLQWLNILRELQESSLAFRHEDVYTLLCQAAWQIGELDASFVDRAWHVDAQNSAFVASFINLCSKFLKTVSANWDQAVVIKSLIMLLCRILVTCPADLLDQAYLCLRQARSIAFVWVQALHSGKATQVATGQSVGNNLRICELATICRSSYDLDQNDLHHALQSADDIHIFVQCAILINQNRPTELRSAPPHIRALLRRDHRIAHKAETRLRECVIADRSGFDTAITTFWAGYHPISATTLTSDRQWLCVQNKVFSAGNKSSLQQVHYNILRGQLLIDGKQFGRLPRTYTSHPTYVRTFGGMNLDVVPSGAEYITRDRVRGDCQLAFAIRGDQLRVRIISHVSGPQAELVAHEHLRQDLPLSLVEGNAHWLQLRTGDLEFEPLGDVGQSSLGNWRLRKSAARGCMVITRRTRTGHEELVDCHSQTFQMISSRLRGLEEPKHIVITRNGVTDQVRASLPRMGLDFTLVGLELHCDNLSNMMVDVDQRPGTLIGLRHQLILRHRNSHYRHMRSSRITLIPSGDVTCTAEDGHVSVIIDTASLKVVRFFSYSIDEELGRLTTTSGLTSRLYLAYLHAITSYCLPDPLTNQTGVEQALDILSSGAATSFMRMGELDIQLLKIIGALTPVRAYYPAHLRVMQTVHWSRLSSHTQHPAFAVLTRRILEHGQRLHTLGLPISSTLQECVTLLKRDEALQARAYSRWSPLAKFGRGYETICMKNFSILAKDNHTEWRDVLICSSSTLSDVIHVARTHFRRSASRATYSLSRHLFKKFEGVVAKEDDNLSLGYQRHWLNVNLGDMWLTMYSLARLAYREGGFGHHGLTFSMAAMVYGNNKLSPLVPVLRTVALRCTHLPAVPPEQFYDLVHGFAPQLARVKLIIDENIRPLDDTPAGSLEPHATENIAAFHARQQTSYAASIASHSSSFSTEILSSQETRIPDYFIEHEPWINITPCMHQLEVYFTHCAHNKTLREHIDHVERLLKEGPPGDSARSAESFNASDTVVVEQDRRQDILSASCSKKVYANSTPLCFNDIDLPVPARILDPYALMSAVERRGARPESLANDLPPQRANILAVEDLVNAVDDAKISQLAQDGLSALYTQELWNSISALKRSISPRLFHEEDTTYKTDSHRCHANLCAMRAEWEHLLGLIQASLSTRGASHHALADSLLSDAGLTSRVSMIHLLAHLAANQQASALSTSGFRLLRQLAETYILFQHARRIWQAAHLGNIGELLVEYENWRVSFDHEDIATLLFQIDNDFRVRPHQLEIAREMIMPASGSSTVLQLNMGEGKTSVILPITLVALADGTTLVRVIALKALATQMFHLFVNQLGNLVNKRIYYLPFSRELDIMDGNVLNTMRFLLEECASNGGILVAQPEHILSLKLMTIDTRLTQPLGSTIAHSFEELHNWLTRNSRDVLDESDELLHVQYQLIYTSGTRQPLESHPFRWTTIQQLLSLAASKKVMDQMESRFPAEIERRQYPSQRLPYIRLLATPQVEAASEALNHILADMILEGCVPDLNFEYITEEDSLMTMRAFFTDSRARPEVFLTTHQLCHGGLWKGALQVRGLLALGVLRHVLMDKRYRVDYGIDITRSVLAVPFIAKDVPSPRSEFGHPDVAIALTALSYYYGGLNEDQLLDALRILRQGDDPQQEYEKWIARDHDLPDELRHLSGINIKDLQHFRGHVLPYLSWNQHVIDYYLSNLVFPAAAREYPYKLSTSGCDLAEKKRYPTTGFSGTNDRRYLLPVDITQASRDAQAGTNALVLAHLLRPENDSYQRMSDDGRSPWSARRLIDTITAQDPPIRVLLDVGAQMLELSNLSLVTYWLSLHPGNVTAAVFFNEEDELSVLTTGGLVEPLDSSTYKDNMDKVVVYLDDAHTRGTDLKLPVKGVRAALTLGPKVTKDRLVQGAMRLRQLGHGQSVMFYAPPECDARIRAMASIPDGGLVRGRDVLAWAMQETCADLRHYMPHWTQQGLDYCRRSEALSVYQASGDISVLRQAWLVPEARTLEETYGKHGTNDLLEQACSYPALRDRLRYLRVTGLLEQRLDEEQEREVSHEIERQQQAERSPPTKAAKATVDPSLRDLITKGKMGDISPFKPLAAAISSKPDVLVLWTMTLRGSQGFFDVVESANKFRPHSPMHARPIRWLLSYTPAGKTSQRDTVIVALSPHEVNELLPDIRSSNLVHLHIYAPRMIQSTPSLANLRFHTIPPLPPAWLSPSLGVQSQLNLMAGQLFFDSYRAYYELCAFLGLYSPESRRLYKRFVRREGNGYVRSHNRGRSEDLKVALNDFGGKSFQIDIVSVLREYISFRRNGQDFSRTHLGQLLRGRRLWKDDHFQS